MLLASYSAEGKVAKFKIELDQGEEVAGTKTFPVNMVVGGGAFIAERGSDASAMLASLEAALQARKMPEHVKRVERLAFRYTIFGRNQTRDADGGFHGVPPGSWTAMKIFMPATDPDEDDCEVFLNFDATAGKGEFSQKDVLSGDEVLRKLATVL